MHSLRQQPRASPCIERSTQHSALRKVPRRQCAAVQQQVEAVAPEHESATSTSQPSISGRTVRLYAAKAEAHSIAEQQRPLADYMALPASQYSVLDARKVERIDDSTFRCYVGGLNFFSFRVEPVITVSVTVEERGCTIRLLSCELQGSPMVEDLNTKFTASMTNVVRWQATEAPNTKEILSDTSIEVVAQVPGWFSFVQPRSVEAVGSRVMQTALNIMVPRFLEQLRKDYERWAAGDDSRQPLGEEVL